MRQAEVEVAPEDQRAWDNYKGCRFAVASVLGCASAKLGSTVVGQFHPRQGVVESHA